MSTPATTPTTLDLADFPNSFSPMIVKELRQGLRTKTFIAVFLGIQVLLVISCLIALGSDSPDGMSGSIFVILSLVGLLIQPMRAMGAITEERQTKTLELINLTRLTPWKIVSGKWISIVAQTAVIFLGVAPYLVIRYLLGGMNFYGELTMYLLTFMASMTLSSVVLAVSALEYRFLRTLISGIGVPFLFVVFYAQIFSRRSFGNYFSDTIALKTLGIYIVSFFFVVYTCLEIGSSSISERSDSRAIYQRIGLLIFTVLICIITQFDYGDFVVPIIMIPFLSLVLLAEEPSYYLPTKNSLVSVFFSKGWHSGIWTFIVCIAIIVIAFFIHPSSPDSKEAIVLACFIHASILPRLVINFLKRKPIDTYGFTILMWILFAALATAFAAAVFEIDFLEDSPIMLLVASLFPTIGFGELMDKAHFIGTVNQIVIAGSIAFTFFVIAISSLRQFRFLKREYITASTPHELND